MFLDRKTLSLTVCIAHIPNQDEHFEVMRRSSLSRGYLLSAGPDLVIHIVCVCDVVNRVML